jgi:hypothetical protein
MPTFTEQRARGHVVFEYATVGEVLEFVNRVREAGGADTIEALPLAVPKNPRQCLLARALNFECEVRSLSRYDDGAACWHMCLPYKTRDEIKALAEAAGLETYEEYIGADLSIVLPREIGNVARAFDKGEGWTYGYVVAGAVW